MSMTLKEKEELYQQIGAVGEAKVKQIKDGLLDLREKERKKLLDPVRAEVEEWRKIDLVIKNAQIKESEMVAKLDRKLKAKGIEMFNYYGCKESISEFQSRVEGEVERLFDETLESAASGVPLSRIREAMAKGRRELSMSSSHKEARRVWEEFESRISGIGNHDDS